MLQIIENARHQQLKIKNTLQVISKIYFEIELVSYCIFNGSQFFHPNYLKVIAYFTDFPELKSGDGRQNDQQTSDQIGNSNVSDISSNASTLSEESTNTVHENGEIVTRALLMLGDESGSNRISNSSGILSGGDSQEERLTELLNRTKVNSTHSCLQCLDETILIALLLLSSVWNLIFLFPI